MSDGRLAMLAFAVLALAAALGAAPARAQCPPASNLGPPRIVLQMNEPKIVYHHDVDLFGLPKIEHHSERPPAGWVILGLTKLSDQMYTLIHWAAVTLRDGRVCVRLTEVDAQLGDPVMNVYVASEYAPDTCEYKTILAHENTHVRFNIETLRDWMPSVRAALTEAATRKFPAIFPSNPTADDIRHFLLDNMSAVFDLMSEDLRKRNATIDTPENYRREHTKCGNWSRDGFRLDGK